MLRWAKQAQRLTCLRDLLPATLQAALQGSAIPGFSSHDAGRGLGTSAAPCMEFVALNNLSDNPGATRTVRSGSMMLFVAYWLDGMVIVDNS